MASDARLLAFTANRVVSGIDFRRNSIKTFNRLAARMALGLISAPYQLQSLNQSRVQMKTITLCVN